MQSGRLRIVFGLVIEEHPESLSSVPAPGPGSKKRPHRWRRRLFRIGLFLLALLVLLIIFRRPLLTALLVKLAATENIQLSLDINGTVFKNLSLRNIRAVPNGKGPTPVENISIDEVTVEYSIPALVRKGFSEFLESYTLRNAYIALKPVEGTTEQKSDLASTLHGLIQNPALFSNRVEIDNLNLVAHVPDGDFAVKKLDLSLDPAQPGALDIGLLQIPKVRTWTNLHAASSYVNRDMILTGLEIDPQIIVQKLELDASRRAQGINRLNLNGAVFGGAADFSLLVTELPGKHANKANNATAQVDSTVTDLSLEKLSKYFAGGVPAVGSVKTASIHIIGDPNTPSSWTGAVTTDIGAVQAGGEVLDRATLRLDISKGWATFGSTLFSGANWVTLQADGKLPDSLDGFAGTAISGWLDVSAGDLRHFAASVTTGKVAGDGAFDLRNNTVRASLDLHASNISATGLELSSGDFKTSVTKLLPSGSGTTGSSSPLDGLDATLDAQVSDIRAADYAVDSASAGVSIHDGAVRIGKLAVQRAANILTASGTCAVPSDLKSWSTAPATLSFLFHAPSLAAFNDEPNLKGPDGAAEAWGLLTNGPGGYRGGITASLSGLRMQDFAADGLQLNVSIRDKTAFIDNLDFELNPTDGFSAAGSAGIEKPYAYSANVRAQIRDLAKFNSLVPALKNTLAGALNLDWQGNGDISTLRSNGNLDVSLKNGRVQDIAAINVAVSGSYSPEQLDFPTFSINTSRGAIAAVIEARNDLLRVNNLAISQGGHPVITGSVAIPLDIRTPAQTETLIPEDGPLVADLASADVALDQFFPKGQAPATGTGKVTLSARGTIDQPNIRLTVAGRNLVARAANTLAPATFDADFALLGPSLSLKARMAQPSISPVEIAGTVPFPLKQILHSRQVDPNSPVQLSIRVPPTSLTFLTRLVPAVRYIQGNAQAAIDVAGTIRKPTLNGNASVDLPAIRFTDPTLPTPSGFRADIGLAGNQLTIRKLGGELSGGTFDLTGNVLFADLVNPRIDLLFTSKKALVMRNEDLTVRLDSNVRVTGPLAGASVAGDIGITQSRFFKQIEILPLTLPGHPVPKPPPAPTTNPGINTPPLRDWKFALKIHTEDPFLIHGNLANGEALVDLSVGGTGKAPTVEGNVRIENFVASLPFSNLNITNGLVYFSKDQPFVPQINIQAVSTLQDYEINVFIYGTASDPKTVMSSEPPLPQEDIVSLLATGATTANLTNGDAVAGRAAFLVLQEIYHKVFKAKAPANNESFSSRFKVDVGGVDPRTGQQELSSSFKLSEEMYFIGDLDVGGDIRGQLRYLLRFK